MCCRVQARSLPREGAWGRALQPAPGPCGLSSGATAPCNSKEGTPADKALARLPH